jgi:hypothetical protein
VDKHKVIYLPASKSRIRRGMRWFVGPQFWMTYRLPFQRSIRISYPDAVKDPKAVLWADIVDHEMVHVEQFSRWWAPWFFPLLYAILPLPAGFSGRWYIERRAYLRDIMVGRSTVDEAVRVLWQLYLMPWPPVLMRRWFHKHLNLKQ